MKVYVLTRDRANDLMAVAPSEIMAKNAADRPGEWTEYEDTTQITPRKSWFETRGLYHIAEIELTQKNEDEADEREYYRLHIDGDQPLHIRRLAPKESWDVIRSVVWSHDQNQKRIIGYCGADMTEWSLIGKKLNDDVCRKCNRAYFVDDD